MLAKKGVDVCYTLTNLLEFLRGICRKNFSEEQQSFREMLQATGGRFLPTPASFAQAEFNSFYSETDVEDDSYWMDLANHIAAAQSYEEIETERQGLGHYLSSYLPVWKEKTDRMKAECLAILTCANTIRPGLNWGDVVSSPSWRVRLWNSYLNNYLLRFKIDPKWTRVNLYDALKRLDAFVVFASAFEAYHRKLLLEEKMAPQKNDYLDLEQLIYLADMDFFITNERRLRGIANYIPETRLSGRVISGEELLRNLEYIS
jgi:hypothetical protein